MGSDGRFLNSRLVANTEDKVEGKTFWAGTVERGALDASLTQSQVLLNYTFDASSSRVWKTDYSGLTRELDLDDKELIIFQTLIPTGYWMIPEVTKLFDFRTVGSYKTESGREIERLELRLKSTELESVRGLPRDNELIQARLHIDTVPFHFFLYLFILMHSCTNFLHFFIYFIHITRGCPQLHFCSCIFIFFVVFRILLLSE